MAAILLAWPSQARPEIVDKIAANVNGSIILLSEVQEQKAALQELRDRQGLDVPDEDMVESRILSTMIDEKLAASYAREREIDVKESEVDKAVQNIRERNNLGAEDFKRLLEAQGATMAQFRERVKNQILIQKVVNMEVDSSPATEEEARQYYSANKDMFVVSGRIRARHILVLAAEDASSEEDAQAAAKIGDIRRKIVEGAEFSEMAAQYSADASGKNGGDLGWLKKGELMPSFEKAAFALEAGQLSEPVRTQFGYHLIQVTEKEKAEPLPYGQVAEQIKQKLSQMEFEKKRRAWLDSIRSQAFVEIMQ